MLLRFFHVKYMDVLHRGYETETLDYSASMVTPATCGLSADISRLRKLPIIAPMPSINATMTTNIQLLSIRRNPFFSSFFAVRCADCVRRTIFFFIYLASHICMNVVKIMIP